MMQPRQFRLFVLGMTGAALLLSSGLGHAGLVLEPHYLRNLSSGTKLIARHPILIPANQADVPISTLDRAKIICLLRMKESKPFDRVIRPQQEIQIQRVTRAGFSAPHRIATTTYVQVQSEQIQDVACFNPRNQKDTTYHDFERSLSPQFRVELSSLEPLAVE